jgi:adenylate cyclase
VETLVDRGAQGDVAEAEAVVAKLAAAPVYGLVIRDVWAASLSRFWRSR